MKGQSVSRLTYRLLICLHPRSFRRRFGKEMLWIFDLSIQQGHAGYMLYDGVRSVIVQHAKLDPQQELAAPFGLEIQTSSLTVARLGQATVLAATLLSAIGSIVAREMPPVWHFDKQQAVCLQSDRPAPKVVLEIKP